MAGFAASINGILPPVSIYDKKEEDYYQIYSDPPGNPPEGKILLQRMPYSTILKVTIYTGESFRLHYGPDIALRLREYGVREEKVEKILDYVWNFYHAYVIADGGLPDRPQEAPRI